MEVTALLLSRLQFAFTISFHIIFPSFTIGLAAWLTILEALHLATTALSNIAAVTNFQPTLRGGSGRRSLAPLPIRRARSAFRST